MDADALSRAPNNSPTMKDQLAEGPVSFNVRNTVLATIGRSDAATLDPVLERVKEAAETDPTMVELRQLIRNGFPNDKSNLSISILVGPQSTGDRRHRRHDRCRHPIGHSEKLTPAHSTRPATDAPRRNQATPASPPNSILAKHGQRHH